VTRNAPAPLNGRNERGVHGNAKVKKIAGSGSYAVEINGIAFEISGADAEDLMCALTTALRPHAGVAIIGRIQEQLDSVMDRLMTGEVSEDGRDPGRAEAYTMAMAIFRNLYNTDYPAEKQRQVERWNRLNPEED
jgi:hypothetical protein